MIAVTRNPLIRLEFIRRFRSGIAAWAIPMLILLPGLAVTIAYVAGTSIATRDPLFFNDFGPELDGGAEFVATGVTIDQVESFGEPMLIALFVAVLFALMVLIPAVVGGSVSSERSNDTLQPLQLTSLTPTDIVAGKLVSSVGFLMVLLLCLAPTIAIPFLVGGVSLPGVLRAFGLLLLVSIELSAVALAVSALLRKPVTSIISSLLTTGLLVFGPFAAMGVGLFLQASRGPTDIGTSAFRIVASISPVSMFAWVGDVGTSTSGDAAGTGVRVGALLSWGIITAGSLLIARKAVTAPVARDR